MSMLTASPVRWTGWLLIGGAVLFMIGAILAYDPARGLLARRGGDA